MSSKVGIKFYLAWSLQLGVTKPFRTKQGQGSGEPQPCLSPFGAALLSFRLPLVDNDVATRNSSGGIRAISGIHLVVIDYGVGVLVPDLYPELVDIGAGC